MGSKGHEITIQANGGNHHSAVFHFAYIDAQHENCGDRDDSEIAQQNYDKFSRLVADTLRVRREDITSMLFNGNRHLLLNGKVQSDTIWHLFSPKRSRYALLRKEMLDVKLAIKKGSFVQMSTPTGWSTKDDLVIDIRHQSGGSWEVLLSSIDGPCWVNLSNVRMSTISGHTFETRAAIIRKVEEELDIEERKEEQRKEEQRRQRKEEQRKADEEAQRKEEQRKEEQRRVEQRKRRRDDEQRQADEDKRRRDEGQRWADQDVSIDEKRSTMKPGEHFDGGRRFITD